MLICRLEYINIFNYVYENFLKMKTFCFDFIYYFHINEKRQRYCVFRRISRKNLIILISEFQRVKKNKNKVLKGI